MIESQMFSLLAIKHGLALECKGMVRSRAPSCYAVAKEILGLTGRPSKDQVLKDFTKYVEKEKQKCKQEIR